MTAATLLEDAAIASLRAHQIGECSRHGCGAILIGNRRWRNLAAGTRAAARLVGLRSHGAHGMCTVCYYDAKQKAARRDRRPSVEWERPEHGWQPYGRCVRDGLTPSPKVCQECPVRQLCLAEAMATERSDQQYRWGVFGGVDAAGRARLASEEIGAA